MGFPITCLGVGAIRDKMRKKLGVCRCGAVADYVDYVRERKRRTTYIIFACKILVPVDCTIVVHGLTYVCSVSNTVCQKMYNGNFTC